MSNVDKKKLRHGMKVTCSFTNGAATDDAKISIDKTGKIYICQNVVEGLNTREKLGYKHSYTIGTIPEFDNYQGVVDLQIVGHCTGVNKPALLLID